MDQLSNNEPKTIGLFPRANQFVIGDLDKLQEYLMAATGLLKHGVFGNTVFGNTVSRVAAMRWRFPDLSLGQAKTIVDAVAYLSGR